jgi:GNAT superfamily N-acetyltransferase
MLLDAADGRFPPVDGKVTLLGALPRGQATVVSFTGHAVIASDLPPDRLTALGVDGFGAASRPDVLLAVAGDAGEVGTIDVTLAARGTGRGSPMRETTDLDSHPRVRHARALRDGVRVYADDRGLVTSASGLAGRRELSVELWPELPGHGIGRTLVADALGLVPDGDPVFAAVAPGNARSLRAFLAAGFAALGSETVIRRGPS